MNRPGGGGPNASGVGDERVKIVVRGAVQGVGFRPFVYRLARELCLRGWVINSAQGVFIEAESDRATLQQFVLRLEKEKPPRAIVASLELSFLEARGEDRAFEIRESETGGEKAAFILPDIATCADCLAEIIDPGNRRFRYPFTNCTNCGPRFSIIEELPYDRPHTSMKRFRMCAECLREYCDPGDRRFHAQPNACPRCGPHLTLLDARGALLCEHDDALRAAAALVREGKIVALKGIGGFQLLVDACSEPAVARLRERKRREEKPFALLYPTLETVRVDCAVSDFEARLLLSAEAPIVLLARSARSARLAPSVAPGNPNLGVMLPYSPLHHLLMRELGLPVIATSGNLSDEPICIDEGDAVRRLAGIADAFLVHDRPIVRQVDDSIVRVVLDREMILRRARGYAPLPIHLRLRAPVPPILAVGAHLKNTVALAVGADVFLSQHVGDLETAEAHAAFRKVAADLPRLYGTAPRIIACDLHPDYLSTQHAQSLCQAASAASAGQPERGGESRTILRGRSARSESNERTFPALGLTGEPEGAPTLHLVQHHYAHILACMAENELSAPVLGASWDGTGYGLDGTVWGGEFLVIRDDASDTFGRVAHLRPFCLPGGAAAIKEPRRTALGLLHAAHGDAVFGRTDLPPVRAFDLSELSILREMLAKGLHSPLTTSAGRLFDAVAALLGLCQRASFEGQGAMRLEFAVDRSIRSAYSLRLHDGVLDWQEMVDALLADLGRGESAGAMAARFHHALADAIVLVAREVGTSRVVLTGGCFQNRHLLEETVCRLRAAGFRPAWHQRVPPNDGGIALGQVLSAARAGSTRSPRRMS